VDIIDTHSNFQNQWLKRRRFFKTQNYKIIQTASSTYTTDVSKWKITFTPSLNKTDTPILDDLEDNIDDSSDSEEITDSNADSTSNPKKSVSGCLLKFKK
jgi:hypothetical protein